MLRFLTFLLALLFAASPSLAAQEPDTCRVALDSCSVLPESAILTPDTCTVSLDSCNALPESAVPNLDTHVSCHFHAKQLIAPAVLLAVGASGLIHNSPLNKLSNTTHDGVKDLNFSTKVDNWIQYIPSVVHLGLGLTGVKAKHKCFDRCLAAATAYVCMVAVGNGLKYAIREKRPGSEERGSFPSGHTATVFTGAELTRIEYGNAIGAAAYGVATAVGVLRVMNDRHYVHDVLAGAGIGILSAKVGYWMLPVWKKVFKHKEILPALSIMPTADPINRQYALSAAIVM